MKTSSIPDPTQAEIRAVRALYQQMAAERPVPRHKARAIAQQLGAPFPLVNSIVAPLRSRKAKRKVKRRRWYARRCARITAEQFACVRVAHDSFMPSPPVGYHKLIRAQVDVPKIVVDACVRRLRRHAGLSCWGDGNE